MSESFERIDKKFTTQEGAITMKEINNMHSGATSYEITVVSYSEDWTIQLRGHYTRHFYPIGDCNEMRVGKHW